MSAKPIPPIITPAIHCWHPALVVWRSFIDAHPELGLLPTDGAWSHFHRRHGKALVDAKVLRRVGNSPLLDITGFERVAFDLLTLPRQSAA